MAITARWNPTRRRRLSVKLAKLKPEIVRDLAPAVETNARMVHEIQVRLVEKVSGKLADSLAYYAVPGFSGVKWRVTGGDQNAFYAKMVEFGTPRNAPSPFFYPAYRAVRRGLKSRMSRATRKAVRNVARLR